MMMRVGGIYLASEQEAIGGSHAGAIHPWLMLTLVICVARCARRVMDARTMRSVKDVLATSRMQRRGGW